MTLKAAKATNLLRVGEPEFYGKGKQVISHSEKPKCNSYAANLLC